MSIESWFTLLVIKNVHPHQSVNSLMNHLSVLNNAIAAVSILINVLNGANVENNEQKT